ncbi:hypothetical protein FACS189428_0580 [Clostridia bacterium]|nr:hypothetical protein FACS189428_0580 [Clostridia bacterium]
MSNVASEVRGTLPTTLKNEFIIETLATGTKLTLNAYDTGGTLLQTFTAMDTTNTVSSIGQWGVTSWNSALFDTIALFSGGNVVNTGFTFTADKTNVKV